MDKIRFSVLCSFCVGLLFCIPSILFYPGDVERTIFVLCSGLCVGLVAAPEINPKLYKNAALFQTCSGAIAGVLAAIAFYPNTEAVILGLLVGGFLGWLGPYWVKHIQIP